MQRKWRRDWERSRSHKKDGLVKTRNPFKLLANSMLLPMAVAGIMLSSISGVYANPTDGQIISGAGTIAESGNTMTINQTSDKLGINWQSFSIGTGETVQFIQPGSNSVALNRVLGNDASSIYGQLSANGKVFLINPNGILFAPGAQVNVGGIVASSLDMSDDDFKNGNYIFTKDGNAGSVVNQGTITAADYAVLMGPQVKNEGVIAARVSALAAGNAVALDFNGDNLLNVTVNTAAAGGSATNSGRILADGGLVIMSAGTKSALLETVVNNSGYIEANSVGNVNGVIYLEGHNVTNSGTLNASGKNTGETGGTVKVLGNTVILADGARVDVSGYAGGGTALIGGNYQGQGPERNATTTTVAQNATINADALTSGNGGKVVVWADDITTFNGSISAKGGAVSGDGGQVETSGHNSLKVGDTVHVNTSAAQGTAGNWLLDPSDFTIASSGGDMSGATLATNLANGNVTILSSDGGSGINGDINVNDAVTWSSANSLELSAYRNINVNANITDAGSGNLTFTYNTGGGGGTLLTGNGAKISLTGATPGTLAINGNAYTLVNTVSDVQNMKNNVAGYYFLNTDINSVQTDWTGLNSGTGYTPIVGFAGTLEGGGHYISGLYINKTTNNTGLFGTALNATIRNLGLTNANITGNQYTGALVGNISNGSTSISNCYSTGTVKGTGNYTGGLIASAGTGTTITNSYNTASVTGTSAVGGFLGNIAGNSSIANSYNTGAVNGSGSHVGGLAGRITGTGITIANSYNTGTVTGGSIIGGLVGSNTATITDSYNTGVITGISSSATTIGGLVGSNTASIIRSFNTGEVKITNTSNSGSYVGGLVGKNLNTASIDSSYSTGAVSSRYGTAGGLVGQNMGSITNSYSAGTVDSERDHYAGGLVGYNSGTASSITNSYSTAPVTFTNSSSMNLNYGSYYVGGLTGNNEGSITGSYNTGAVKVTSFHDSMTFAGGLVGYNTGSVKKSYSTAAVTVDAGGWITGGLVGINTGTGSIENSFATGQVSAAYEDYNSYNYVGGLVGQNNSTNAITNTYSTGEVSSTGNSNWVGGFAGSNSGQITNGYSTGKVSSTGNNNMIGGFTGKNTGQITNDYSTGEVSSTGTGNNVGGFAGENTGALSNAYWDKETAGQGESGVGSGSGTNLTGLTTVQLMDKNYLTGMGWDFGTTWYMFDGYTRPFLQSEYSITISNTHQLQLMVMDPTAAYTLGANINMSELTNASGMWNTSSGFVPVGDAATAFTGTFNGNGHTISGLAINSSALSALGLFGYLQGATISNVGLTNVNITGGTNNTYVGAVAGYNDGGTLTNVYTSGAVSGGKHTGGLVGYNTGTVETSYSASSVSGTNHVGGLAGTNAATGRITDSYYAMGTVTGQGGASKAGGIAGANGGTIDRTYSTGTVTGDTAGGLVGDGTGGTVTDSVWNTEKSGQANGVGNDADATGVTGLTSAQMRDAANYPGTWDFSSTWVMTGSRPLLQWQSQNNIITSLSQLLAISDDLSGVYILGANIDLTGAWTPFGSSLSNAFTGSMDGNGYTLNGLTITGSGASALGLFGYTQGATISSVNLTGVNITAGTGNLYVGSLVGYSGSGTSIANCTSAGTVTASGAGSTVGGLVGYNAGSIENSSNTASVTSTGEGSIIGGLVGLNAAGGSLTASYNAATVSAGGAHSTVGGLVGKNQGSSTSSYGTADGLVTSDADDNIVGGLIGENDSSIDGLYNNGVVETTVNATNNKVGGLVGKNNGTIIGSYYSTGTVTANGTGSSVGGLAGYNTGSIAGSSYNAAAVTANGVGSFVGGLVGTNNSTVADSIKNTYNTGAVTSTADSTTVGGLVGENVGGVITQSSNTGAVTTAASATSNTVGGLVGRNAGTVSSSYNAVMVSAQGDTSIIGGLVGENDGSVTNAYSIAQVSGSGVGSTVGGLVGQNDGNIQYAYSVGAVAGTGTVGGLVGLNSNTGSVANAYWYEDASTPMIGSNSGAVDSGTVLAQTRAQMMQSGNYTGWDLTNTWGVVDGSSLPYLQSQFSGRTPQFIWGTVQGGGVGRTVNVAYRPGNQTSIVAQLTTLTADGFYYLPAPLNLQVSPTTDYSAPLRAGNVLLLYVDGYRANGLYRVGSNGLLGGNLIKDTLVIDGGSTNIQFAGDGYTGLTSPDIIFSNVAGVLTVNGNIQAHNFSLSTGTAGNGYDPLDGVAATGSITIDNDGDFIMNSVAYLGYMKNQQISAGGDIRITTGGNFILRHGVPDVTVYEISGNTGGRSADTQLIAGGDIIIRSGGAFINHSGPEALQLTGNGRWLIYAPNQFIYAADRDLFYTANLYANGVTANTKLANFYMGPGWRNVEELANPDPGLSYDVRGGMTGDFIRWAGETVPDTGNGFIFGSLNPAIRPLTPAQLQRKEAIIAAQSGQDQTGTIQSLDTVTLSATTSGASTDNLPFLTIVDGGVAMEEGMGSRE